MIRDRSQHLVRYFDYGKTPTVIYKNKDLPANISDTYKIVKKAPTDFEVQYKVNPGQTWNDGTPITAVDLLLSHVVGSSAYSKEAGLGDPLADEPLKKAGNPPLMSTADPKGLNVSFNAIRNNNNLIRDMSVAHMFMNITKDLINLFSCGGIILFAFF